MKDFHCAAASTPCATLTVCISPHILFTYHSATCVSYNLDFRPSTYIWMKIPCVWGNMVNPKMAEISGRPRQSLQHFVCPPTQNTQDWEIHSTWLWCNQWYAWQYPCASSLERWAAKTGLLSQQGVLKSCTMISIEVKDDDSENRISGKSTFPKFQNFSLRWNGRDKWKISCPVWLVWF